MEVLELSVMRSSQYATLLRLVDFPTPLTQTQTI